MTQQPPAKPPLLDQVRHHLRLKHYSIRTEETYVQDIRQFILFHNKRDDALESAARAAEEGVGLLVIGGSLIQSQAAAAECRCLNVESLFAGSPTGGKH
jgi:hypothetical protein